METSSEKPKTSRAQKYPKYKKRTTKLKDKDRIAIFRDYANSRQSLSEIARKYGICRDTAYAIVKKFKKDTPELLALDAQAIEDRKKLNPIMRVLEVKKDAKAVVEATLALMLHLVQADLKRAENDGNAYKPLLSPKELTAFFVEAAPYALNKMDAAKGKSKDSQDLTATGALFQMYRKESAS